MCSSSNQWMTFDCLHVCYRTRTLSEKISRQMFSEQSRRLSSHLSSVNPVVSDLPGIWQVSIHLLRNSKVGHPPSGLASGWLLFWQEMVQLQLVSSALKCQLIVRIHMWVSSWQLPSVPCSSDQHSHRSMVCHSLRCNHLSQVWRDHFPSQSCLSIRHEFGIHNLFKPSAMCKICCTMFSSLYEHRA